MNKDDIAIIEAHIREPMRTYADPTKQAHAERVIEAAQADGSFTRIMAEMQAQFKQKKRFKRGRR